MVKQTKLTKKHNKKQKTKAYNNNAKLKNFTKHKNMRGGAANVMQAQGDYKGEGMRKRSNALSSRSSSSMRERSGAFSRPSTSMPVANNTNTLLNTVKYRSEKELPNITDFYDIKDSNYIIKSNANIKIIEGINTTSGSVFYFVTHKNNKYIIKQYTFNGQIETLKALQLENEKKIYEIMNKLVKMYITPCVIMQYLCVVNYTEDTYTHIQLNETNSDINSNECISLHAFFEKYFDKITPQILLNILFQITYTLKCFNIINLQHNDLHINNVLVFLRTDNILDTQEFVIKNHYNFKYDKKNIFKLYNLGIDIRIFDFDQSTMDNKTNDKTPNFLLDTANIDIKKNFSEYADILLIIRHIFVCLYELNKISLNENNANVLLILLSYLNNIYNLSKDTSHNTNLFIYFLNHIREHASSLESKSRNTKVLPLLPIYYNYINLINIFIYGKYCKDTIKLGKMSNIVENYSKECLQFAKVLTPMLATVMPVIEDKDIINKLKTPEKFLDDIIALSNLPEYLPKTETETTLIDTFNINNIFNKLT